jgi:hypothetical protein
VEGSGHCLFQGAIPEFAWRNIKNEEKSLSTLIGVPAEIRKKGMPRLKVISFTALAILPFG